MRPEPTLEASYQDGDRVRIKNSVRGTARAAFAGRLGRVARDGVLQAGPRGLLLVQLDGEDAPLTFETEHVQNRTVSALRSWKTAPKAARRVGRPKLTTPKTRVSLGIDHDIWEALGRIADSGRAGSRRRDQIVNALLREYVTAFEAADAAAEGLDGVTMQELA